MKYGVFCTISRKLKIDPDFFAQTVMFCFNKLNMLFGSSQIILDKMIIRCFSNLCVISVQRH